MNKKSIKVKVFKLPSIAAFKRLSFKHKAIVFRDWAATKKGKYVSISNTQCALSQFGVAMGGDDYVHGSSHGIYAQNKYIPVMDFLEGSPIHVKENGVYESTFLALSKRLTTYINKHYGA